MRCLYVLAFASLLLGFVCPQTPDPPEVTTKLGKVRGVRKSFDGKDVDEFLGIPYAQPPVGRMRFERPRPVTEPWTGTFDASNLIPCSQMKLQPPFDPFSASTEDCLHLNVWTPDTERASNDLKPVMVYIHGGAFFLMSSSFTHFLSAVGDVVVASMNYRLGALGFLYGGRNDAPGNVGLWDQTLALEWVKDNIAYFGGDPDQVTIFGMSAGAMSVGHHLLSPESRPLFRNAVSISGMPMNRWTIESKADALGRAKRFADRVGCGHGAETHMLDNNVMECLWKMDIDKLLEKTLDVQPHALPHLFIDVPFKPIYGDRFQPRNPYVMLKEGDFKTDGSVIVGVTNDEGSIHEFLVQQPFFYAGEAGKMNLSDVTEKGAWRKVIGDILRPQGFDDQTIDKLMELYFHSTEDGDGVGQRKAFRHLMADYYFGCPAFFMAELMSKRTAVYGYISEHLFKTDAEKLICSDEMDVCHGADFQYTMGQPLLLPDLSETEKNFTISMMQIWSTFAKTGKPPADNAGVEWLPFYSTPGGETVQVQRLFNADLTGYAKDPLKDKCRVLNEYLKMF